MITLEQRGGFDKTLKFLQKASQPIDHNILEKYGELGVQALRSVTPVDSGMTADSWYYEIERNHKQHVVRFCNRNVKEGFCVAILLRYGHATGNGGWAEGTEYINPTILPLFDELAEEAWKEVNSK